MTNDHEFAEFADGEEPTRLDIPRQLEPTIHPAEARLLKFLAERADSMLEQAKVEIEKGWDGDAVDLRNSARVLLDAIDAWKEHK